MNADSGCMGTMGQQHPGSGLVTYDNCNGARLEVGSLEKGPPPAQFAVSTPRAYEIGVHLVLGGRGRGFMVDKQYVLCASYDPTKLPKKEGLD